MTNRSSCNFLQILYTILKETNYLPCLYFEKLKSFNAFLALLDQILIDSNHYFNAVITALML